MVNGRKRVKLIERWIHIWQNCWCSKLQRGERERRGNRRVGGRTIKIERGERSRNKIKKQLSRK